MRASATVVVVLALLGCSDDSGSKPADMAVEAKPADGAPDVALPDQGGDAGLTCDTALLGVQCTPTGTECGAQMQCLASGFCSCPCTPDLPTTKLQNEDSCPVPGFACGLDAASKQQYCFALLANTPQPPDCSEAGAINADPTDPAFIITTHITPTNYPFTITNIHYMLQPPFAKGTDCDNGLAHRAELHVGDGATPQASPTIAASFDVAADTATDAGRWVVHGLSTPVQLTTGQSIYLMVEIPARVGGKTLCPLVCSDNSPSGDRSFIDVDSNQPPYQWESFKTKTWPTELGFAALGFAGP